jgi:hypothetical protein
VIGAFYICTTPEGAPGDGVRVVLGLVPLRLIAKGGSDLGPELSKNQCHIGLISMVDNLSKTSLGLRKRSLTFIARSAHPRRHPQHPVHKMVEHLRVPQLN